MSSLAYPRAWERRAAESDPAWRAFVLYRDQGQERSIRRVAQELNKSASLIGRWSAAHDWAGRVAAWASEQDRVRRDTYLDEVEQVARRHARALEDQVLALSSPAAELAMRVLARPGPSWATRDARAA